MIVRPKIIKFADEVAMGADGEHSDEALLTQDFVLQEIQEFFQSRRSVVLVDLEKLKSHQQEKIKEVSLAG